MYSSGNKHRPTGLRALNEGDVWPLDFLTKEPNSLPEFPK